MSQLQHLLELMESSTSASARDLAMRVRDGRVEEPQQPFGQMTASDAARTFAIRGDHHRAAGLQNNVETVLPALAARPHGERLASITVATPEMNYTIFATEDLRELVAVIEAEPNPNNVPALVSALAGSTLPKADACLEVVRETTARGQGFAFTAMTTEEALRHYSRCLEQTSDPEAHADMATIVGMLSRRSLTSRVRLVTVESQSGRYTVLMEPTVATVVGIVALRRESP